MMKNDFIQKFFQKKEQLTLANKTYQNLVHVLVVWLLENDHVQKDQTTKLLFGKKIKNDKAKIITREPITVAGLEEICYLINTFTSLKPTIINIDGRHLQPGETIMKLQGNTWEILAYERVILNLLQRLSGIATETYKIISRVEQLNSQHKPQIAATRKTPWGLLDKKAVAMGGGLTHRLNLADGILVKDNHLMLLSATEALTKLLPTVNNTLIEIEVENKQDLFALIETFNQNQTDNALAILLDNFTPDQARQAISELKPQANIIYEASGGITQNNVSNWATTGVDIISLGSLTHSPKAADLSLEII